jgi:pimeloyl-ACP methyl ester carboxylesterase
MKIILNILKYFAIALLVVITISGIMSYYPDKSLEELKAKYANTESEFMDLEGMPVHYRDEGNPADSIPLILIHGTGSNLHTWDGWTETIKGSHRIIRFDLPAYGLTGPNKNHDYSAQNYTEFLHQFLVKLGVNQCYMAGNSLGGLIAWEYALKYPQEIKKLILIDAAGYPMDVANTALVFKLAKTPILNQIFTKITPKAIVKKSLLDVYGDPTKVTDQLVEQYHDMACRVGNRDAFISRTNLKFNNDYLQISKIKAPTLLLWGDQDRWIKIENAYKFQKDLQNDTLIVYKGIGHVPMEEHPIESAKDVLKFLEK